MKRNIVWGVLALAALCGQLAVWPAQATRPAQPSAGPAQPFALVKDINTTSQPISSLGENQIVFGTVNNHMLFSAFTPETGSELWRTDGTPDGTQLVKDVLPGESGAFDFNNVENVASIVLNGRLLFTPNDGAHGTELWVSDGTPDGTQLLKDIFPGADSSSAEGFIASSNHAFFVAQVGERRELWSTDGTPTGTRLLHSFAYMGGSEVLAGNSLFFDAADVGIDDELWKSDGTVSGTVLVKDIKPGSEGSFPGDLFAYSASEVWFRARSGAFGEYEMWRSNGSLGGTQRFLDPAPLRLLNPGRIVMLPRDLQSNQPDRFVFNTDDGTHGQELWVTDGTPTNTALLQDINPNSQSASPSFLGFGPSRSGFGRAIYALNDGVNGAEPWVTDGTSAGTVMLANIFPRNGSNPSQVTSFGNASFFAATSATAGRELWKTDSTPAGTAQVADINAGTPGSEPENLTIFNGMLYFTANDGIHGRELWRSDGTAVGTAMLKDISAGNADGVLRILGAALGALYFTAGDGATGWELWKTDGTPAGTVLVQNIAPDTGGIFLTKGDNVGALGDKLLFGIDLASNGEALVADSTAALWRSDGTGAGTTVVTPFPSSAPRAPLSGLTTLGNGMLFTSDDGVHGQELWRTDGTAAGTAILTNTVRPNFGDAADLTRLNNLVIFDVYTSTLPTQPQNFTSLWRSDGTPAGTQLITKDVTFGRADHAISGNTLFFANSPKDHSSNVELWKTDGTTAGTRQISEIAAGDIGSNPHFITPGRPGEVFFIAHTATSGFQLWKSDGTAAGTVFVHDVAFTGDEIAYADGALFFTANDGAHGDELWKSDGTDAGTGLLADIYPGNGSSKPENLIELNGVLFFSATGPDGRRTLWISDGTSNGTLPVRDDASAPLNPSELTVAHGRLLFSANDAVHGREPWRSDGTAIRTAMLQDIVPGTGSSDPEVFIVADRQVYFTAITPENGRELWALTPAMPGQSPAKRVYLPLLMR
jgi:ELWxxDGT repeat protein